MNTFDRFLGHRSIQDSLRPSRLVVGDAALTNVGLLESLASIGHIPPLKSFYNPIPAGIVFITIRLPIGKTPIRIIDSLFDLIATLIVPKLRTTLPSALQV